MSLLDWTIVSTAATFGAIGGIAAAIGHRRHNPISIFGWVLPLGIIGDAIVGAAGGVAVQIVADANAVSLHVIGLALLAGVAGNKFLFDMSGAIISRVVAEQQRITAKVDTMDQVIELIREGERLLGEHQPHDAEMLFRRALELDGMHPLARLDLAKSLRHQADAASADRKAVLMTEAIKQLGESLHSSPRYDRALYNRACYRTLMGALADAIRDLEEAVGLFPGNADLALRDPDFAQLREDPRFKKITGVPPAVPG